jgi:hypothetical protein
MIKAWLCAVVFVLVMTHDSFAQSYSYVPPDGFVPDSTTAVAVAEAILIPIFGRIKIMSERPFTASLEDGHWTVEGHLQSWFGTVNGGVAFAVIDKTTGQIIRVGHGR